MSQVPVDEATAGRVWDAIVEHCGARNDTYERDSFIYRAAKGDWTEWRFGGVLGFGGKVWNNAQRFYVSCYREDETPERRAAIDKTNAALDAIFEEVFGEKPAG